MARSGTTVSRVGGRSVGVRGAAGHFLYSVFIVSGVVI